jgi:hypothetical protein
MSQSEVAQLKYLIKKKKAGMLTNGDEKELMDILHLVRKNTKLPPGIKVAAGIILAAMASKQKPKELTA